MLDGATRAKYRKAVRSAQKHDLYSGARRQTIDAP